MPERKHLTSGNGPLQVNTKNDFECSERAKKTYTFVTSFFSRRPNWLHCWRRCALRRDGHLLLDPLHLHVRFDSSQIREWIFYEFLLVALMTQFTNQRTKQVFFFIKTCLMLWWHRVKSKVVAEVGKEAAHPGVAPQDGDPENIK